MDIINLEMQANNGVIQEYSIVTEDLGLIDSRHKLWEVGIEEMTGATPSDPDEIEYLKNLIEYFSGTATGNLIDDRRKSYELICDNFSVSHSGVYDIIDLARLAWQAIVDNDYALFWQNENYLILDGVDDSFDFDTPIEFADATKWAISFFAKVDYNDSNWKALLGEDFVAGAYSRIMMQYDDVQLAMRDNTNQKWYGVIPQTGDWNHYAFVCDGAGNIELFVNAVSQGSKSFANTNIKLKQIGKAGSIAYWYDGQIDEMYFFTDVLTQSDITTLAGTTNKIWTAGSYRKTSVYSSLEHAYRFENTLNDEIGSNDLTATADTQYRDVEYYFVVADDFPFANVGLGYDRTNDIIYVAVYDYNANANKIRAYKPNGTSAGNDININSVCVGIQGLAYNENDETFWVWGRDPVSNDPKMFHINKSGAEISGTFALPGDPPPNACIDIHPITGHLWVRGGGNAGGTARIQVFDLTDGSVQTDDPTGKNIGWGGEGLYIDRENTTADLTYLWLGYESLERNYRKMTVNSSWSFIQLEIRQHPANRLPYDDRDINYFYDTTRSPDLEVEGMILANDGNLYIGADNGYHGQSPNGNRVWMLEL